MATKTTKNTITKNKEREREIRALNRTLRPVLDKFRPPENLTVDEWADRYRILPASSAESGLWRTSRTPYLREILRAFNDPKVESIAVAAASQVGKSEVELNIIGYIIDQDPGNILYVHPNIEDARRFSRQRVTPMIQMSKRLKAKVRDSKTKKGGDTILQKIFPGGSLTLVGTNSPSSLASIPCRYIIGDEVDRFKPSAGKEGDPWELAKARQRTFYNRKSVEVSTPTDKGNSNIETAFLRGTQERWRHQCPACGDFFEIKFDDIKFDASPETDGRRRTFRLNGPVLWCCPGCGAVHEERIMRQAEQKWTPDAPEAYETRRTRSFWLSAFASPWVSWGDIVLKFLDAKDDPDELKVVYNTLFGEVWEDRGAIDDAEGLMARREDYGLSPAGTPADCPEKCLALTIGVDVQDDRLEYEAVGHGLYGETYGVRYGRIMGDPTADETWERLDDVIDRAWVRADGETLTACFTAVDSGGHQTQTVYEQCRRRQAKRVFAVKGKGGEGVPYVKPPTKQPIKTLKKQTCWLYSIGTDAGKAAIMSALKVQSPGPKYCHFPLNPDAGYDVVYFTGLLSEKLELTRTKNGNKWMWVKIRSHIRNEALDCRDYAMAGFRIMSPDLDALDTALTEAHEKVKTSRAEIKAIEAELNKKKDLQRQVLNAHAGKDLHAEYLKLPKKKQEKFYEENRPALMLYDAAMRYFKENGIKTVPTAKRIQDEIEDLTSAKNAGYTEYRESQKREKELQTVKANIEKMLRLQEPEIEQEHKTHDQEL